MNTPKTTQSQFPNRFHTRVRRAVGIAAVVMGAITSGIAPSVVAAQVAPTTAPVAQQLYAGSSWATLMGSNLEGYIIKAFDDSAMGLTGAFAKNPGAVVRFFGFQPATLQTVQSASIEVRMAQANWVDDEITLEYSVDGWRTAHALTAFSRSNRLPTALTTYRFDGLQGVIATPELARSLEVRLRAVAHVGKADVLTLKIDGVRLNLTGA